MKFNTINKRYSNLDGKLSYNEFLIQKDNSVNGKETLNLLEENKEYFMKDYEGYCDYYLIIKENNYTITMIPLWYYEKSLLKTGEGSTDLFLSFTVSLPKENLSAIAEHMMTYTLKVENDVTLDDFWLVAADEWVSLDYNKPGEEESKKLLKETYFLLYKPA